ncbi:LuxR C-terminal-related transcriptional regulator [Glycomyces salinus]|uniref:LuxR C-terminal-related transcriptional regulator n=1 Tax=Glycomyces salinus TaxID=980294 RepID=UPI0018EB93D8|nr:LuxR C-terminal-related transcriptional regulator [Glycomyces salinus]
MDTGTPQPPEGTLNDEDSTIIDFLYDGLTQKAIGRRLGIRDRTVRRRLEDLKSKLGADNSLQIPLKARDRGVWKPRDELVVHRSGRGAPTGLRGQGRLGLPAVGARLSTVLAVGI